MRVKFNSYHATPTHVFTQDQAKTGPSQVIVAGIFKSQELSPLLRDLDTQSKGMISTTLALRKFEGNLGQSLYLPLALEKGISPLLLIGFGKAEEVKLASLQEIGGHLFQHLRNLKVKEATICFDNLATNEFSIPQALSHVAHGLLLRTWEFNTYKTKKEEEENAELESFTFLTTEHEAAQKHFAPLKALAESVNFTRQLVSEPANVVYPASFVKKAQEELTPLGVEIEVLGAKEMQKLGMNALLGVAQGSDKEAQLLIVRWNGTKTQDQPIAIVGKGVTFDTGGISIKPANNMEDMKMDMAGAAVVVGLVRALAARKAAVNIVGVAGLVENMPSGTAQRPGDIVKSMSGKTIEVLNTDAEGRLVLADALWYTQDRFKPAFMIDLATLTGAIVVSLGHEYAGLFANNEELAGKLISAGEVVKEPLWRLPLSKAYDKEIDSPNADVQNLGTPGTGAGSITAAQFLQRFVNDTPWAHLDIAGVAYKSKPSPICVKGATGFGVRLLNHFIQEHYEGRS